MRLNVMIIASIVKWILILCLPALLISASLAWGFNSLWLYKYGFQKYDVSQSTGLAPSELEKAARGLIAYFNSGEEYVHITVIKSGSSFELFTTEEQIHFKDVKQLIRLDYGVLLATLLLVIGGTLFFSFWQRGKYRPQLPQSIVWGSGLTIILILILGIASLIDFDWLFLQFHFLAFTNPYWSASGYMLMLFPGGFWLDAALFCIGLTATLAVILGFVVLWAKTRPKVIDKGKRSYYNGATKAQR
jgi:integral membrane protein (TIGR01906 family)